MNRLASIIFSVAVLSVFSVSIQSCKDDDEPQVKNEFTYDGKTYALAAGDISYYADTNDDGVVHEWTVSVYSDIMSGIAHGVHIDLIANTDEELPVGTYTYDANNDKEPFSFFFGTIVMDYDMVNEETGTTVEDFESGTVKIERTGTTYKVTFDITVAGGKKVVGSYTGELDEDK